MTTSEELERMVEKHYKEIKDLIATMHLKYDNPLENIIGVPVNFDYDGGIINYFKFTKLCDEKLLKNPAIPEIHETFLKIKEIVGEETFKEMVRVHWGILNKEVFVSICEIHLNVCKDETKQNLIFKTALANENLNQFYYIEEDNCLNFELGLR